MNYLILTFQSTHHVLKAERVLLSKHIKLEIIPTPKEVSSECGMSIRINPHVTNRFTLSEILADANLEFNIFEKPM
ncbi:MAG: DUF3343 domain-containing protein [Bacteroidales bacterium]|jgi:hypothetical protein|nr:DUF3343 domain-containing protein [Bacteroidales bacterium]MDD4671551.1 DUF3343 domain-containing protein [Bacteroidales bacterium]MDY0348285.1 DUF3343 domain-containing protein [Tenuifilaceae bacterium]